MSAISNGIVSDRAVDGRGESRLSEASGTMLAESTTAKPTSIPSSSQSKDDNEGTTFSHHLAATNEAEEIDGKLRIKGPSVEFLDEEDTEETEDSSPFGRIDQEDYWVLLRRFNKQMQSVRVIQDAPPGDLDLNISDEEEFSPDKLRSCMERIYMTIIIGVLSFYKHIVRIRSWRESRRTTLFCAAYFFCWSLDLLVPLIIGTSILLIAHPPARSLLFPPAPIALISTTTGELQEPPAGVLGTTDTFTGAPENHTGEAAEQEAYNFVTGLGSILIAGATGENPLDANEPLPAGANRDHIVGGEGGGPSGLNRMSVAGQVVDSKAPQEGLPSSAKADRTRRPMEAALWDKTRPMIRALNIVADAWERCANALSPTPPFPTTARRQLTAFISPIFVVSLLITSEMLIKTTTFILGILFFSQPVIDEIISSMNVTYPNWYKRVDPRNSSILRHIPTNAQLTLTLLRLHAYSSQPILPTPPVSNTPPPTTSLELHPDDLPIPTTTSELDHKISPAQPHAAYDNPDPASDPSHPHRTKLLHFLKKGTKVGVLSTMGTDRLKAAVGSKSSKDRVGAVIGSTPSTPTTQPTTTEIEPVPPPIPSKTPALENQKSWVFSGRFNGKKGYLCITPPGSASPTVSFHTVSKLKKKVMFTISLADVVEIRKVGGLGWKGRMVVGWSLERSVVDGVLIKARPLPARLVDRLDEGRNAFVGGNGLEKGRVVRGEEKEYKIMAMKKRDEVFNALLVCCTEPKPGLEGQGRKWECI